MASSLKAQVQERQITDRANNHTSHSDDNNFVINMCGLHNTMELWRFLPRHLIQLVPMYMD